MDKNEKQNCAVTLMPLEPLEKGATMIIGDKIIKSNSWVLLFPNFQICYFLMMMAGAVMMEKSVKHRHKYPAYSGP